MAERRPPGAVLLRAEALTKDFRVGARLVGARHTVHAVAAVDLTVRERETVGIVGESGSGKTTLAAMLVGDEKPTAGRVDLMGEPLHAMSRRRLRRARRDVQLVRQDPFTSLDPRMTVEQIVREPLDIHPDLAPRKDRRRRVRDLIALVALDPTSSTATPTSSPAASDSGSASPARSRSSRGSWCATSRCRRSTCPCRHRW